MTRPVPSQEDAMWIPELSGPAGVQPAGTPDDDLGRGLRGLSPSRGGRSKEFDVRSWTVVVLWPALRAGTGWWREPEDLAGQGPGDPDCATQSSGVASLVRPCPQGLRPVE